MSRDAVVVSPSDLSDGETQEHDASPLSVRGAGIDTVSFAWQAPELADRVATDRIGRPSSLDHYWMEGFYEGVGVYRVGRVSMVRSPVGGARVGAAKATGLVFVEGRANDLVGEGDGLLSVDRLPEALDAVLGAVRDDLYVELDPSTATLRRADVAVDLSFEDGVLGQNTLRAFAAVVPPRRVVDAWMDEAAMRCVYLRSASGKRVEARVYDKGHQTGTEEPGKWLRAEWQFRENGQARPSIDEFTSTISEKTPFASYFGDSEQVAFGADAAQIAISEALDRGEMTARTAERLLGSAALLAIRPSSYGKSTATSRRRALLRAGIGRMPQRCGNDVSVRDVTQLIVNAVAE